ncbi:MAG TPA: DoxX family protein, partial [Vicinamibacterales bacterium]
RFIGTVEVLGALGLILPGLFRIWSHLTPLAAAGLVSIMIGATVVTLIGGTVAPALFPAVVGLLCGWIALARSALVSFSTPRTVARGPWSVVRGPWSAVR